MLPLPHQFSGLIKIVCIYSANIMACISTWSFGKSVVENAKEKLQQGIKSIQAVVTSIGEFEENIETGCYQVGRGGYPNTEGILQCDAAIMDGSNLNFGAVAGLEQIPTPIYVAESVLKHSSHSMLVGDGAKKFALEHGFALQDNRDMMGDKVLAEYNQYLKEKDENIGGKSHDTLGVIAMDKQGNITAGVSTSGMKWKHPGRVGDSPLPGCGLYADNTVGGACATGDGDHILKFCPSHMAVMLMSQGKSPQEACEDVVRSMCQRWNGGEMFEVGLIAMNNKGDCGAATTLNTWTDIVTGKEYGGFSYVKWNEGSDVEICVVKPPDST